MGRAKEQSIKESSELCVRCGENRAITSVECIRCGNIEQRSIKKVAPIGLQGRVNGEIYSNLEFGTILAATNAEFPSVFQIRTKNIDPHSLSDIVVPLLNKFSDVLNHGALISVDDKKERVRILPLK